MKVNKPITDKDTRPFTDAKCGYYSYRIRFYESGYVPNYEEGVERRYFSDGTRSNFSIDAEAVFALYQKNFLTEGQKLNIDSMLCGLKEKE